VIEKLKLMLRRDEGEVNHAYQDSEGYWTIGVGRLIDNAKGGGITHEESMYLLGNDIKTVLGQCDREFDWFDELNEARKIVILNMVFNMGLGNFKNFKKTIAFISAGDYDEASIEMLDSTWSSQVGNRAARLSNIMKSGTI